MALNTVNELKTQTCILWVCDVGFGFLRSKLQKLAKIVIKQC